MDDQPSQSPPSHNYWAIQTGDSPVADPTPEHRYGYLFSQESDRVWNNKRPPYEGPIIIDEDGGFNRFIKDAKEKLQSAEGTLWHRLAPLEIGGAEIKKNTVLYHQEDDVRLKAETIDVDEEGTPYVQFRVKHSNPVTHRTYRGPDLEELREEDVLLTEQEIHDNTMELLEQVGGEEVPMSSQQPTIEEERVRVPFADQFREPVLRGEKDGTLRLERYGLEAGDEFVLTNESGRVEWALAEVTYTFTCSAGVAYQLLDHLNANHALTKTDKDVVQVLQPHYSEPVTLDKTVQGILWEIEKRFARDVTGGDA